MIGFTLSDCVLKKLKENTHDGHLPALIFNYCSDCTNNKLIIDDKGLIIDLYTSIAKDCSLLTEWLRYMGENPKKWESINIKNIEVCRNSKELILTVCSESADKILVVESHNGWIRSLYNQDKKLNYNGHIILSVDKYDAYKIANLEDLQSVYRELGIVSDNNTYTNCIIAENGSTINNSKLKVKNE